MYSKLPCGGHRAPAGARIFEAPTTRCRSAHLAERIDDAVDDLLDQPAVVALAHDADDRLGSRGADDQTAVAVEALFAMLDGGADLGVLQRLAALVAHVLEDLRERIEAVADL